MTAYAVVHIEVTDPEAYPAYASRTVESAAPFGGTFLVKGGAQTVLEGTSKPRTAIIAFPDRAAAEAWYASPGYQQLKPLALKASVRDFIIVDGI